MRETEIFTQSGSGSSSSGGDTHEILLRVGLTLASRLIEQLPAILMALAAFVAAWRAHRTATGAKDVAEAAQGKAEEAAREQVNFALRAQAMQNAAQAAQPVSAPQTGRD